MNNHLQNHMMFYFALQQYHAFFLAQKVCNSIIQPQNSLNSCTRLSYLILVLIRE